MMKTERGVFSWIDNAQTTKSVLYLHYGSVLAYIVVSWLINET